MRTYTTAPPHPLFYSGRWSCMLANPFTASLRPRVALRTRCRSMAVPRSDMKRPTAKLASRVIAKKKLALAVPEYSHPCHNTGL